MPKLVSLKVIADMKFAKKMPDIQPEEARGEAILSLSLAKAGGAAVPPTNFSVTLIPITFPSSPPLITASVPKVQLDNVPLTFADKTEGFYYFPCNRTDTENGQWFKGIYVFGVKVKLTDNGVNYVGQTLVRLVVD